MRTPILEECLNNFKIKYKLKYKDKLYEFYIFSNLFTINISNNI